MKQRLCRAVWLDHDPGIEMRYVSTRPKQLALVGVQFDSVGRHPLPDVGDAHLQLSRCSSDSKHYTVTNNM